MSADKVTILHTVDAPKPPVKPMHLIRLSFRLTAERYEHELALVANLPHASAWATDVWFGLPARTEKPNAVNDSLVQYVAAVADECGLGVVMAPRAFAAWGSAVTVPEWYYEDCYRDPAYWAWVIQGAKESAAIIAQQHPGLRVKTGLDAEVYGDPLYAWLKNVKFGYDSPLEFEILAAIRMATSLVGKVNFGKPWDSDDPTSVNFRMRGLIEAGITGKGRHALTAGDLNINPPPGVSKGFDIWELDATEFGDSTHVSVKDVLAFDYARAKADLGADGEGERLKGVSLHLNACGSRVLRMLGEGA